MKANDATMMMSPTILITIQKLLSAKYTGIIYEKPGKGKKPRLLSAYFPSTSFISLRPLRWLILSISSSVKLFSMRFNSSVKPL